MSPNRAGNGLGAYRSVVHPSHPIDLRLLSIHTARPTWMLSSSTCRLASPTSTSAASVSRRPKLALSKVSYISPTARRTPLISSSARTGSRAQSGPRSRTMRTSCPSLATRGVSAASFRWRRRGLQDGLKSLTTAPFASRVRIGCVISSLFHRTASPAPAPHRVRCQRLHHSMFAL